MAPDLKYKRSKSREGRTSGRWITARKITQYVSLLVFLALFIMAQRVSAPENLVNLPMRLDPLLSISHLLASRTFLLSSWLALIVVLLSLIFGRAWCGWICPLGTTLDIFSLGGTSKKPTDLHNPKDALRKIKYGLLIGILIAAIFRNLTLLILDPLTMIYRTLTVAIWPALDSSILVIERTLYRFSPLRMPVSIIDSWLRPRIFPLEPMYYRDTLLIAGIFLGVIVLNIAASRFWCRYLCPLGALLGLLSKFALFHREVASDCKGCTLCTQICPTGTIDPKRNYASDQSECTMCLDCLEICPRNSISFVSKISITEWRDYDPDRRQALTAFGLTIAALAILKVDENRKDEQPFLLRPPGSIDNNLISKCTRCAECMRSCPTGALQPVTIESSIENLWTPMIVPRLGYCDYSCNACGQICPVQAIPPLNLEKKRHYVIGKAYIDQNRCIAWSDHIDCIVCEEMCPLPEKAISLKLSQISSDGVKNYEVQLPSVNRDLCIGCGICEYKCPVTGEAAIRVYVPTLENPY